MRSLTVLPDMENLLLADVPSRVVMYEGDSLETFCHTLSGLASRHGKNVAMLELPDDAEDMAVMVERVEVAMTKRDILTGAITDVLVVKNVFRASLAHRNLPSSLKRIRNGSGQSVVYLAAARDPDVPEALRNKREFLRALGPLVFEPFRSEDKARLKAYLSADRTRRRGLASDRDEATPSETAYVLSIAALTSMADLLACTRDTDALESMSQELCLAATESFPRCAAARDMHGTHSSQALTRCGMHANARRALSIFSPVTKTNGS